MTIGSIKTESILPLSDGSGKQAFMTGTKSGTVVAGDVAVKSGVNFVPSNYSADKTITTTAAGELLATGTLALSVDHLAATDTIRIAFGVDANDALANVAAGGVPVRPNESKVLGVPANAGAYAWVADTGTGVTVHIAQGI